jgi:hypothetical protein
MNASHSARRYFSIHSGTEQIPATEPTSDVALRLNPRVWVGWALYAFESQFPLWPHEWRHPTPVSPVRATVKRLFIGSAPDALLLAAFRFLFVKTLGRSHLPDQIPFPKCHKRLPAVLSQEDVTRLIASSLMHRTMIMTSTRRECVAQSCAGLSVCVVFLITMLPSLLESRRAPWRGELFFSNPSTPCSRNLPRHNAAMPGLIFNSSLICLSQRPA